MALTNNEKVLRSFDQLLEGMRPWVDMRMSALVPAGKDWTELVSAEDTAKFGTAKTYSREDVRFLLRVVTERWKVFEKDLSRPQSALASELRETANAAHHGQKFSSDDTYRALDTIERLLTVIGAGDEADAVAKMRMEHQREVFEKQTRNRLMREAQAVRVAGMLAGTAIKPWREVVRPHADVIRGQFSAAEFAADLYAVAHGHTAAPEYLDPAEFFSRTYLTSGLSDLLTRALKRLSGDAGASPVVNLQTQFGGGKTHSMLALYHLFSEGLATSALSQGVQDVVHAALPAAGDDPLRSLDVRRVTLVGTKLSPSQPIVKDDGTRVRTIWGELAWQLGGRAAYDRVAMADATGTDPGDALDAVVRDVVADGKSVLILIDEWVAYARQLVGRDDLPGGSFATQHTFAQHLTEMAKSVPGVMLVVSIPASDSLDNGGGGSALEVGGPNGHVALETLQHTIGRNADDWRPANNIESFEIVRRRLFEEPDAVALADISAVAKQYVKYYQENTGFFPRETTTAEYEQRIRAAYPIHPELFDRLYEDWSTLPKFQRTRGVLRLMSVVINALWAANDTTPLITPGAVPVHDTQVFSEITKYLDDNWKPVVDKDVDGEGATPVQIDRERPSFGQRALTRRVARSVFIATVPTLRSAHKGVDMQQLRLGTAVPGDVINHIGDARALLGQRATYFYEDGDRSWYDLAASVSRVAADRAAGYGEADVHATIVERLKAMGKAPKASFGAVHAAPLDTGDIPDSEVLKLVVLHPRFTWGKDASTAADFAERLLREAGSGQRQRRNMLVMVAADRETYPELEGVVREYRAWQSIADEAEELELSAQQRKQSVTRARQLDAAVDDRVRAAFTAALVPTEQPGQKPTISFTRVAKDGGPLAERVTAALKAKGWITPVLGATLVRMALEGALANAWGKGHVRFGDLWSWYTQYPYLKRLPHRQVLEQAVLGAADVLLWQQDAFALADGYDEAAGEYRNLWIHGDKPEPGFVTDDTLLVQPGRAVAQRARVVATPPAEPAVPAVDTGHGGTGTPQPGPLTPRPAGTGPQPPLPAARKVARRFWGVKALNPNRPAADFANIQQEVLAHLEAADGVRLEVRIEITATTADGFTEQQVRTVRENAVQLKFEDSGFEEN
ncbi:Swt1 family HEPN domain-containing protein [Streptomyces sp. NRRL F-2580]|uniref:Swt1 family HEPN domain-containing protein n=1 Tax=Streptomyces sp. NRRL F-2580 TaxID=1463841 RepID=UPI0004C90709|nr:Swt1 family HEPN domain-containing protein [Streptomyces sp. NRRL F-2580]